MIGRASLLKKRRPLLGSEFECLVQDLFDLLPAFGGHTETALLISWCNQTLAVAQSLFTVAEETPNTASVSSVESPPKKRNFAIRLCRTSSSAKPFRPSSIATRSTLLVLSQPILSSTVTIF